MCIAEEEITCQHKGEVEMSTFQIETIHFPLFTVGVRSSESS